jgi:Flp pilus assembly protein TadD
MMIQFGSSRGAAAEALTPWRRGVVLTCLLLLSTGCVRHTVSQDFGLSGFKPRSATPQKTQAPDSSVRSVLQKQKIHSFDPVSDDPRVQTLQTRLKANNNDFSARLELATIYESYRLFADASEQYMQALQTLKVTPETDGAIVEQAVLGFARVSQPSGRAKEALPLLESFAKEKKSASAWNQLGLLYDTAGDLGSGEKAFQEGLALNSQADRLHNNLGYNLLLQRKTETAAAEFQKALEINPVSAVTRNNLGVALARLGDLQGALAQFEAASDPATAHNNLAVVLLESGEYEQSREELVKALAIRHSFAPAMENFKLVQERIRGEGTGTQSK